MMYEVDELDRVVAIDDLPQSDTGAPIPLLLSDDHRAVLAYYVNQAPPGWDGKTPVSVGPRTAGMKLAIVVFELQRSVMFGPPNDEALEGHPLGSRGLSP